MKIKPEHYEHLRDTLTGIVDRNRAQVEEYFSRDTMTPMRKRWDLLHAARLSPWISSTLYPYMNDDHLDTALRRIVSELGLQA